MKKIIVTGGLGFIASNFCHYLNKKRPNIEVIILDSNTYAANIKNIEGLNSDKYRYIKCDIVKDVDLMEELITTEKIDTIVHFAAESHNDNSLANPGIFISTNIVGTYNILELCRKYNLRLHHISTDEVYGDLSLEDPKFEEESNYNPSSPYSASKASADMLVRAWVRSFAIKATISNCSNNFGPRQHIEKFIPRQITNLLMGQNLKLYGSGENIRDWIYVDDHSSAVLKIIESGKIGETYLIGANCEKTNKEVAEELIDILNGNIEYVSDRPGHDFRYAINATKIQRELGWTAEYTDFNKALRQTIKWYDENREYWEVLKDKVESNYAEVEYERKNAIKNKSNH